MWFFSVSRNGDRGFMLAPPFGSAVLEKTARVALPDESLSPLTPTASVAASAHIGDPAILTLEPYTARQHEVVEARSYATLSNPHATPICIALCIAVIPHL
jgi:hypothetical protein